MAITTRTKGVYHTDRQVLLWASVTMALCLALLTLIHPVWTNLDLHVPGEDSSKVTYSTPVDSIFYVRNAARGYIWSTEKPTSLWFHPVLSLIINALPVSRSYENRFWFAGFVFAFGTLIYSFEYVKEVSYAEVAPKLILLVPLLPGGIGIVTGNAEFPCLFFTTLLMLSVLRGGSLLQVSLWAALAILTKPNALYMIPILGVYLVAAVTTHNTRLLRRSATGILVLVIAWLMWILFVDYKVGQLGAYWEVRQIASVPLTAGPLTFLQRTARVMVHGTDTGEKLKFLTALVIPLVDLWLLSFIPLRTESHRYSIFAGILAMLAMTFLINNPNKIIVYITTFPGHVAIGVLFLREAFKSRANEKSVLHNKLLWRAGGVLYILFCLFVVGFYIVGTPLEWYY